MGPCPACAAPTEPGDRFCSACGDALAHPPDADADAGRRGLSPWALPAAAVAVLVLGLALWAVGRAGRDPTESADPTAPDPTTATTSADSTATTGESEATTASGTEPPGDDTYDASRGGPVLGRPIGWSLIAGSPFDGTVSRFDLDTGEWSRFAKVRGGPLAALDGKVVLLTQDDSGGSVLSIVPQDDPAADGIDVPLSDRLLTLPWPVQPDGNGNIWTLGGDEVATSWWLIRLRDGAKLDEVATAPASLAAPVAGAGPEVASSGSGGVYRRTGDGYRFLGTGVPMAVSRGAVLTKECTGPLVCPLRWIDLETGQPVERAVPVDDHVYWFSASSGGRFLVGQRLTATAPPFTFEVLVHDLESGRIMPVSGGGADGGFAASPDGRFLAVWTNDGLHLYDVEADRWVLVDRPGGQSTNLVFAPNGSP